MASTAIAIAPQPSDYRPRRRATDPTGGRPTRSLRTADTVTRNSEEGAPLAARPSRWRVGAVALAWCAGTAIAALAGHRLAIGSELALLLPVLGILLAPLFAIQSAWAPPAAAVAALLTLCRDSAALPDLTTQIGLTLAATLGSVGVGVRAARERRQRHAIARLEEDRRALVAANAAQQEAAEVAAAILTAAQDISGSLDTSEVPLRIARNACTTTRSAAAAVLLWDAEREVFRVGAVAGDDGGAEVQQLEVTLCAAAPLQGLLGEEPVDLPREALQDPVLDALLRRWKAKAILVARLQRGEHLLGAVITGRRSAASASAKARRILSGIALEAAAALENARLVTELRTANNLKEEFMATMSHELRTPLNVIIGYTDLQRDGAFGDLVPDHLDMLNRVRDQSVQLLDLVQATLDVGQLERGLMTVDLRDVAVPELMEQLSAAIPPGWRKPAVQLLWSVDPAVPRIRSDPVKLQVVLRNLVHNALKFTQAGQVAVTATTDAQRERVHFVVQDSGAGIAADDLTVIFEMFRQSANHDPRTGGVGLGLYIVKRLVGLLGGEVDVQGAPGRGATFCVHLPVGGPHDNNAASRRRSPNLAKRAPR